MQRVHVTDMSSGARSAVALQAPEQSRPTSVGDECGQRHLALAHEPATELRRVSKVFEGTVALEDVSLALYAGEVLGLVGENGAGKSTCVKILGGVYRPDAGHVWIAGEEIQLRSPLDAHERGIAVVHQHPSLFADLSIAENVFAGQLLRGRSGLLDHRRMWREASRWLAMLGLRADPGLLAGSLRTSEQQLVEIARALAAEAKVVILDEPTAALSIGEVERLFAVIGELRMHGVAMMFVGHRLEEIARVCDRVAVLRDGVLVATRDMRDISQHEIVRMMVGRPLTELYPKSDAPIGDVILEVTGLAREGEFQDVSLSVRSGEIVGMAGLVGSGRTELARVLFGITKPSSGRIALNGEPVRFGSAADALAHGIAYLSEDRRGQGVVEEFSVLENATLPVIERARRFGLVFRRAQIAMVARPLEQMRLRFRSYDQPVTTLSGGNQQKVVIAKWLATNPRVLILDEPTQGIDVQTKAEVHRIISGLAAQGLAILLISSDLPELLGMCDRILVMRKGSLAAEFDRGQADQFEIGIAATGAIAENGKPRRAVREQPRTALADELLPRSRASRGLDIAVWLNRLASRREAGLFAALLAVVIPISALNASFLHTSNLEAVSTYAALIGIVALGELVVMLTRNIDISVASVIGLTAYIAASTIKSNPQLPLIVPVLVACGIGLACGLVNGVIVGYGGVPSIVVTLGTLAIYRGVDSIVSNGKQVAVADVPNSWLDLTVGSVIGVPRLVWLAFALFAAVGCLLRWTSRGREIYAVGSNPAGARLIGVPLGRRVLMAFALCGLLAGFDGALWASHYGTVDGQLAYGLELTVVASVVVGGVALRGGRGSVAGVALGTFILLAIQNALTLARVDPEYLQAFFGAAILAAVVLDVIVTHRVQRVRTAPV
jgi:ABC-type sugar transport system ATPase subunit/ribose/xylose/arabinose/galactoside ABC-type transport system permease subunit